ncbi:MAG: pantetheine-phosphate adenylyltransferase [Spirochaetes bacterium]|jgi:pantetheine-phosphate adenylyltransferase|nr:pantetheine-phosphate adenylyltransferase [Spirochaetota bacterium]
MRIGIYPGSFDPLTNGHLDIFERSKKICDKLIITAARNIHKNALFSIEERLAILRECCKGDDCSIEITTFDGLLVDFCKQNGVNFIVRGIRAINDYEYEYAIALMNRRLAPDIETIFLMARSEYSFISSNMVKEVASYGGDISTLVPPFVNQKITKKFSK